MKKWKARLGLFVLVVCLIWAGLELRAKFWEARWDDFVKKSEVGGESFGVEQNLPKALSEEQEFELHPWIRRIAERDPEVLDRLAKLDPSNLAGYQEWKRMKEPDGVLPPMPVELAEKVRVHSTDFKSELNAFAEALGRPGTRMDLVSQGYSPPETWVGYLLPISRFLAARCHAAAELNEPAAFIDSFEIALHTGDKLRLSNLSLAVIAGSMFERDAYEALSSLRERNIWSRLEFSKLIAALELRTRPLADEFAAVARVARGRSLEFVRQFEGKSLQPGFKRWVWGYDRVYFAQLRLGCCEGVQIVMDSTNAGTKIEGMGEIVPFIHNDGAKADGWNLTSSSLVRYDEVLQTEKDRAVLRQMLESVLRSGAK